MAQSDFAARAAKALGVDGVVMVDINRLNYFLYTGAMGSGRQRRAALACSRYSTAAAARCGNRARVVYTEASGAMVAGGINPAAAPILNRDIGTPSPRTC